MSGRGPNGISGACEMTSGGGFWGDVGVTAALGLGVGVVTMRRLLSVVVVVVVASLPKNFLKPPNQLDFFVVVSVTESRGSGVISTSLL